MGKINPEFAQRLREIRKERGLTLEDIENAIDVTNSAVSKWENGERDIKLSYLKRLAKFLKVPVNWLIGETKLCKSVDNKIIPFGEYLLTEYVRHIATLEIMLTYGGKNCGLSGERHRGYCGNRTGRTKTGVESILLCGE